MSPVRRPSESGIKRAVAADPDSRLPSGDDPSPALPVSSPEIDAETLGRWRWQLGATARKAVAARVRADAALAAWERLVADAADAGVPARLVMAAAADAGIDTPGAT